MQYRILLLLSWLAHFSMGQRPELTVEKIMRDLKWNRHLTFGHTMVGRQQNVVF